MRKIISIFTIIFLLTSLSFASSSNKGTRSLGFLKIGVGARGESMGGAQAAVIRDVNSIYWNPAGLNGVNAGEVSFMHCIWFQDITYDQASFAHRLRNDDVIGFMINYLTMSGIEKIDNTGLELNETYKPKDVALTFSYAKRISDVDFGANIKYISSKIEEESGTCFALDLGLQSDFSDKVRVGLAMQNLGTKIQYMKEKESIPFNLKGGLGYKMKDFLLAMDVNMPVDKAVFINFGVEYNYVLKNKNLMFSPRLGLRTDKGDLEEGSNSISAGLGLKYKTYNIDYAWAPYGELGTTHRISLLARFGKRYRKIKQGEKLSLDKDYEETIDDKLNKIKEEKDKVKLQKEQEQQKLKQDTEKKTEEKIKEEQPKPAKKDLKKQKEEAKRNKEEKKQEKKSIKEREKEIKKMKEEFKKEFKKKKNFMNSDVLDLY